MEVILPQTIPPPAANETTPPATANDSEPPEPAKPEIVAAFLNGDYVTQDSDDFTQTLTQLEPYLDIFLTMDDVLGGASDWLREKYPEAA
ncbi:hypothetical protein O3W44_22715 [Pantoea sp. LMR881]|uniref:hypothetical protein n=1 Tax=Pantoea sp. LMR881 TaxID=3014336 RepID=UPI0022AF81BA|nr:hypothetical protein [Pantoea sp. LMR881]MCZ4061347.1 hypothetical protein [Pantoea sp. LMR881]